MASRNKSSRLAAAERIIVAFDPGLSGACAMISVSPQSGRILQAQVFDLPTMGAGSRRVLNGSELAAHLRYTDHAVVENVHAMPKQGVSGVFRFGTAFGQILGVLQALMISYELVEPAKWKREMRLPGGKGKGEASRQRALQLYPRLSKDLSRKKDHNRAEALLLALWWAERDRA